jgi:hypothetical protein
MLVQHPIIETWELAVQSLLHAVEKVRKARMRFFFTIYESDLAGGLGFEPRQSESESEGLPLADPPTVRAF